MGYSGADLATIVECFNSQPEIFVAETSGISRRKEKGFKLFAIDITVEFPSFFSL